MQTTNTAAPRCSDLAPLSPSGPSTLNPQPSTLSRPSAPLTPLASRRSPITSRLSPIACLLLGSLSVSAQEAVRNSQAGEEAAEARDAALESQTYNIQYGLLRFLVKSSLGFEYNDNISYQNRDAFSDAIVKPSVSARAYMPVTDHNALNLSLGLGYWKYFEHPDFDYIQLSDGTELAFDVFVKDFRFTLYDRISYTEDPVQSGAISGIARFGGLDNTAGLKSLWDMNKVLLTADYGHRNFLATTESYDFLDRASELLLARSEFRLNPVVSVGPELSGSLTRYDQDLLHNGYGYSAGVFGRVRWSTYLETKASAGFTGFSFDPRGADDPVQDPQTYYWSLEARHRLNEQITHTLSAGHELRLGIQSDYEELNFVRYFIDWKLFENIGLQTQISYENGAYPRVDLNGRPNPAGVFLDGEDYNRLNAWIGFSYKLMEKVTATAAYRHLLKTSDIDFRNYSQNSVLLTLTYQF